MATITEDYVSFEVAKLLKEKGFDEPCNGRYSYRGGNINVGNYPISNESLKYHPNISGISAPTLQMAMKWLREVHNINIDIVSVWNQKRFEYQGYVVTPENAKHCYRDDKLYLGYEEAAEAEIKYCLEDLI